MIIEELGPSTESEWDDYVNSHAESTCYHNRTWAQVAQTAYRIRPRFLIARPHAGAKIEGAFPLFRIKGMLRPHMSNGIFGAYAPILAESREARSAILARAQALLAEEKLPYLLFKTIGPTEYSDLQNLDSWVIATLKLKSDPEEMWKGFRDKIRNMVRKAQKHNMEVRSGHAELASFYDVLAENMHKKGAPIYGLELMRGLLKGFGDQADIITLYKDGKCIAGCLLLMHRKTVAVPFASSRPSALYMSPNNLLYWEIIRRSCLRGMEVLDFGRSLKNSGPLDFKLGWGAETQPQPCYVHSLNGEPLRLDPNQKGVAFFVNQWKRLPRPVVNKLGPMICRQVAGLL